MIIPFIIFYLIVGVLISIVTKKEAEVNEEFATSDLDLYVLIPLFWFWYLIVDAFSNNKED